MSIDVEATPAAAPALQKKTALKNAVKALADLLGEKEPKALWKLRRMADRIGFSFLADVLDRVDIERAAGSPLLLRADGEPRTPGGVFFAVAKAHARERRPPGWRAAVYAPEPAKKMASSRADIGSPEQAPALPPETRC